MFPLGRHKQQAVVFALKGMGFSYAAAVNAARTTGANLEVAAQLLVDGGQCHFFFSTDVAACMIPDIVTSSAMGGSSR